MQIFNEWLHYNLVHLTFFTLALECLALMCLRQNSWETLKNPVSTESDIMEAPPCVPLLQVATADCIVAANFYKHSCNKPADTWSVEMDKY